MIKFKYNDYGFHHILTVNCDNNVKLALWMSRKRSVWEVDLGCDIEIDINESAIDILYIMINGVPTSLRTIIDAAESQIGAIVAEHEQECADLSNLADALSSPEQTGRI